MERPALEVADLVRAAGERFVETSRGWLSGQHLKVLSAIERCRTAALGGHLDECSDCSHRPPISYNSCRNRHCPKCQANTRKAWLEARHKELLPVRYLHSVFTTPHELSALALQNKWVIYSLLLRTSGARKPCSKWLALPSAWAPRSASSVFCIAGIRRSSTTPMSTVCCRPAVSLPITAAGSTAFGEFLPA